MDMETQVQILDEDLFISDNTNTFRRDIFPPIIAK